MFKDDTDRLDKLQAINEDEDDLNYQRRIQIILKDLDLKKALIDHTNKHFALIEGLNKVKV